MESIAFDAHKRYAQVSVETVDGKRRHEGWIAHARGALHQFLITCELASPVTARGTMMARPSATTTGFLLTKSLLRQRDGTSEPSVMRRSTSRRVGRGSPRVLPTGLIGRTHARPEYPPRSCGFRPLR